MTDFESVKRVLQTSSKPLTGSEIASRLKVQRKEANSILYKGLGTKFVKSEDERPRWSLIESGRRGPTQTPLNFKQVPVGEIHVDQQGGDWTVTVAVVERSRNDMPCDVEMIGVRQARILVNRAFLGEDDDWSKISLLAGVGLCHQILSTKIGQAFHDAEPGLVLRDVLLALSSASPQSDEIENSYGADS